MSFLNLKSRYTIAVIGLIGVAAQLLLFRQYYWVSGGAAYGQALFLLVLVILPAILMSMTKRRHEIELIVLALCLIISSVWIVPRIFKLRAIKSEMMELAASLKSEKNEKGNFPATIESAHYSFRDPTIANYIQSYQVEGEKFWLVFSGPEPSVSYALSSDGKLIFNDD
jgi:hypothetical protein